MQESQYLIVGGGLAAAESQGKGPYSSDKLRGRIEKREALPEAGGVRGFARAMDLAKDKALLSLSEYGQEHPVAATLGGSIVGGLAGAGAGPGIVRGAKGTREAFQDLVESATRSARV